MPNRKCVLCGAKKQVFLWPTELNLRCQWDMFMAKCMPKLAVKKSHGFCYQHFDIATDFKNYTEWRTNLQSGKATR